MRPDQRGRTVRAASCNIRARDNADRWLAKKRAQFDTGTAVDDRAGNQPLSVWWPGYWRSIGPKKERTKANYGAAWRLRVEPRFGSMPVRRIRPSHVDEWIADMTERGVSASKVIESVGVFKRVLDRAVRDKVIASNPCDQRSVTLPRRPRTDRPVLSPTEVQRLVLAMPHEVDRVLGRLLAYGGLRIGEALALRWSDVELDRKVLTVRESVEDTTVDRGSRLTPLS